MSITKKNYNGKRIIGI